MQVVKLPQVAAALVPASVIPHATRQFEVVYTIPSSHASHCGGNGQPGSSQNLPSPRPVDITIRQQ